MARSLARYVISLFMLVGLVAPMVATPASAQSGTTDVRIWTTAGPGSDGYYLYDICYTLVGFSNTGCDENLDGNVFFADVPYGTYTVQPSPQAGSGWRVDPFTITVDASNTDFQAIANFAGDASTSGTTTQSSSGTVDARIWTSTPTGDAVFDICYTLVEFSNLGCDDNRDGNVLFQGVTPGRYYIEPTVPAGSPYFVNPFTAVIDEYNTDIEVQVEYFATTAQQPTAIPANQSQAEDVHLITRDPKTGEAITDACYELVGYSNIGCDANQDGHITFADIPYGQYVIRQTTVPSGYEPMADYVISVMGNAYGYNGPKVVLLSQSQAQAPKDHLNVSVVFYDTSTGLPVASAENCAQIFVGDDARSNIGCDEDIVDGQVDFMQVEISREQPFTYRLKVDLACGYDVVAQNDMQTGGGGQYDHVIYVPVARQPGATCN